MKAMALKRLLPHGPPLTLWPSPSVSSRVGPPCNMGCSDSSSPCSHRPFSIPRGRFAVLDETAPAWTLRMSMFFLDIMGSGFPVPGSVLVQYIFLNIWVSVWSPGLGHRRGEEEEIPLGVYHLQADGWAKSRKEPGGWWWWKAGWWTASRCCVWEGSTWLMESRISFLKLQGVYPLHCNTSPLKDGKIWVKKKRRRKSLISL